MEPTTFVADPSKPYKAIYAFVLACLTAASGIWLDNVYLTGALALVTALGTYFIPNPITTAPVDVVTGEDDLV